MFLANKLNKGAGTPGPTPDAQFNYVTMLLHGDGTNGAQNNTFLDSSTNNFTITRNGNTTQGSFSPYGSNWSNFFDGSGDYLATSSTQIIPASTTYTVEAWVYLTGDYSDYREIVTQGSSGNANRWLMFVNITDGILSFQTGSSGISTSFTVPRNTWTHLAFVNNGGSYTVYANGTSVGSGSNSVTPQNTYVTVGAFQSGAEYFQGYISNVRITNTAVYTSAFTPSTAPLTAVSGTRLLTCQSNRFIDNSTNTYAITTYGNTSVQRFNPFGASTAYSTSVIGGSGYFDGTDDYLSYTQQTYSGDFTFECWVYQTGSSGSYPIIFASSTASMQIMIDYQGTGKLTFYNSSSIQSASGVFQRNQWNHLAYVRSGSTLTIYYNGTSVASGSQSNAIPVSLLGGYASSGYTLNGYMSDARITTSVLYTTTFTPPTAPLTAISGTSLLLNYTNGAIYDNAMINDLETVGNAQISTSVVKYGTGSLKFDGSGDWLIMPYGPTQNFGTGAFTIEGWFYLNSLAASYYVPAGTWGSGTSDEWLIQIQNNGNIRFLTTAGSTFYSASITTATWYHIAVVRNGSTVTIYVNGTSVGSYTCTNSLGSTAKTLYIGTQAGTWDWNGYIDDFRITNGYARYTSTFTPPTAAFPNIGPV